MKAQELRAMLTQRGLTPRRRLGQNFLIDAALLRAIPKDAGLQAHERVLEVGPGAGALTEVLLQERAEVLAVEFDTGLAQWLRERWLTESSAAAGLRLIEGDVLAAEERLHPEVESWWAAGPPPRIISNLPYSISGPFLARLPGRPLLGAYLLLQSEVADKVAGRVGSKDYGPLSIRLSLAFEVRIGRRVPPEVFWPRPKVSSAFLKLCPRSDAPEPALDRELKRMLQLAFGQRRKRAIPRLAREFPAAAEALSAAGVASDARAEEIPPEAWLAAVVGHNREEC